MGQTITIHGDSINALDRISNVLAMSGWQRSSERPITANKNYLKLCRNGVAAIVDARGPYGKERTYVGVEWATNPKENGYCAR